MSTDYDTVDRLYFEPLTFENVMAVDRRRSDRPAATCRASCSTAARRRSSWRSRCRRPACASSGTSPDSIDLAEDRKRFSKLLWELGIPQAASGTATSREEAREVATEIGFPVVVRPSYVLGGRAMAIVYDMGALDRYMRTPSTPRPSIRS